MIKKYLINNYTKGIFKKFNCITFEKREGKSHLMIVDFSELTGAEKNILVKYITESGLEKREVTL